MALIEPSTRFSPLLGIAVRPLPWPAPCGVPTAPGLPVAAVAGQSICRAPIELDGVWAPAVPATRLAAKISAPMRLAMAT
jgi:hypothetical protein